MEQQWNFKVFVIFLVSFDKVSKDEIAHRTFKIYYKHKNLVMYTLYYDMHESKMKYININKFNFRFFFYNNNYNIVHFWKNVFPTKKNLKRIYSDQICNTLVRRGTYIFQSFWNQLSYTIDQTKMKKKTLFSFKIKLVDKKEEKRDLLKWKVLFISAAEFNESF